MNCVNSLCHCNPFEHFDQSELTCLNNTMFNTKCYSDRTCNSFVGLTCQNFTCQCDLNNKYWSYSENKCVNMIGYTELGCTSDKQCFANLFCDSGMCNCKHDDSNQLYWNNTYCLPSGDVWSKCEHDYQCKRELICLDKISRCQQNKFFWRLFKSSASISKNNLNSYIMMIYSILFCLFTSRYL